MIKFGIIHITGFCSIQELELNLDSPGINIFKGNNGEGKTTIINALVWALFGKVIKGVSNVITWDSVKPKDYKGVKVEVNYEKSGDIHRVTRCLDYTPKVEGSKGGSRLIYSINGDQVEEKGKPQIQGLIEKSLGMSFRLFKNSIVFGQKLKRVAQESGPDKKALFEEAFEVGYLTVAKQIAKGYKDKYQSEYSLLRGRVNSLESEYNTTRDTYKELKSREVNLRNVIKEEVKELTDEISELEYKKQTHKKGYSKKLLTKTLSEIDQLEDKYHILIQQEKKAKEELTGYTSKGGLYELINSVCKVLEKGDIKKALSLLVKVKGSIASTSTFSKKKDRIHQQIELLRRESSKLKNSEYMISSLESKITSLEDRITQSKSKKFEILSPKYRKRRVEIKFKLKEHKSKLLEVKKQLEDYSWVFNDPLSNSGIKTYIFDTSLDALNKVLNTFAFSIGFRIIFTVDGDSKKRDFVTLIQKGDQDAQYDELSGGEQQLCDIAMAFALHNITTLNSQINILFLDEVFESLDKNNMDIVMEMVKQITQDNDKSVYIVTHREFSPSGAKVLRIEKEEGIGTIMD